MTQQRKFSSPSSAAFHSPDQANDTCHMSSKHVYAFAKPRIPTKTMTQQRKFSSPASAAFHSPDQANDTCHMSSKHVYAFAKPSCNMKMFLNQADMQECLTGYPPGLHQQRSIHLIKPMIRVTCQANMCMHLQNRAAT